MISQTQEFLKAIRPLFADPVTNKAVQGIAVANLEIFEGGFHLES